MARRRTHDHMTLAIATVTLCAACSDMSAENSRVSRRSPAGHLAPESPGPAPIRPSDASRSSAPLESRLAETIDWGDPRQVKKLALLQLSREAELIAIVRAGTSRVNVERASAYEELARTTTSVRVREMLKGAPSSGRVDLLQWGQPDSLEQADGYETLHEGRDYLIFGYELRGKRAPRHEDGAVVLEAARIVPLDGDGETVATSMPRLVEIRQLVEMLKDESQ